MSAHRLQNEWDIPTGFESHYMPMRFGGFGVVSPASNTTDMSLPLSLRQRAFQTPSDISPDESMSLSDDTDMNLNYSLPLWLNDSTMLNPARRASPVPDIMDYLSDNSQTYVARMEFPMDM
jgi:hypothetical protein